MSHAPLPAPLPAAEPAIPASTPATALRSRESLALARRIAALVTDRRGTDLVLLDVRSLVDYTDFFLLASGTSGRQNQAIAEHVVRTLKQDRLLAISKSGLDTGSWICLDLGDVVVHVFDPETRARYDLELLWADAPLVDVVESPADAVPAADESEDETRPARRRRTVRKAAVEDADAGNAPDSERPPPDEPEPESKPSTGAAKKRRAATKASPAKPSGTPKPSATRKAGPAAKKRAPAKPSPKPKRKRSD
jgi:ribosome-associated protein